MNSSEINKQLDILDKKIIELNDQLKNYRSLARKLKKMQFDYDQLTLDLENANETQTNETA